MVHTFQRLAQALYDVRRLYPELPVLAIQWMHPKHPVHPTQARLMNGDEFDSVVGLSGFKSLKVLLGRIARCFIYASYLSFTLFRIRWTLRREIRTLKRQRFDLIAKTWCFGTNRSEEDRDFYYGDLQWRLAERGLRMLLLCGDAGGRGGLQFSKAHISIARLCRLPELCLVSPFAALRTVASQLLTSLRLRRLAGNSSYPLIKQSCVLAGQDCLSPSTLRNGLFFWIGRNAVRTWRPKIFMTLYEGHGWEKCAWWGAKTADPECKTVGYQHTVLFEESLALTHPYVDLKERSVPDIVLGLGPVTTDLMQKGHAPYGVRLIPFGSFRYRDEGCKELADPALRTVLVTPEGLPSEAEALFGFAYACAKLLPQYTFLLRSHPVLPIETVLNRLNIDVAKQRNVIISRAPDIYEDFRKSSVLLYRGSSAVLYGVLHGLLPVNVRVKILLDTDPLYMLGSWRKVCGSPDEFAEIVMRHERTPRATLDSEWSKASNFVRDYTIPVEDSRIDELLRFVEVDPHTAI